MIKQVLNKAISIKDFKDNYWLKKELIDFCREIGINQSGGKLDVSTRIERFLEVGEVIRHSSQKKSKISSSFDWNNEELSLSVLITDNYKNTANVREFFRKSIGSHFRFNVEFMNWMKSNLGKTLEHAAVEWREIAERKKNNTSKKEIAPQFEYNTYIRDFLADNSDLSIKDAIGSWKIKRDMPGKKIYNNLDLEFIKK